MNAQTFSDYSLIRSVSFEDDAFKEDVSDSLSFIGRTVEVIGRQMTGECFFEPECYVFAAEAVKELGIIRGIIATTDRITRCSRIGTVQRHHFSEDGKIHEGVEAYRTGKRRRRQ